MVREIFEAVAATAPDVREGLPGRRVYDGAENPSGEQQLAADLYADELLEERLLALDSVASYASEEGDSATKDEGEYHVAVDPLDGSSNLKSNNAMGTIVGVYEEPLPAPGRSLVASGYVLYGPITTMMVAGEDGIVTEYVVDSGEPEAVTEDLELPDDPVVYGFGGGVENWPEAFTAYARDIERELKLRYGGAMIGDVNQVLTYGGVFAYPGLRSRPEGKLRLQFEGNPMAYVVESAGGRSSDGERSLLDVEPTELHQRVPVHLGNAALIDRLERALA
jgi:fructose-1,6-bisphosphatase I